MKSQLVKLVLAAVLIGGVNQATAQSVFRNSSHSTTTTARFSRQFTSNARTSFRSARRSGRVNFNVIENSGNGVGNTIVANSPRNARVNINVIRNSGNGSNNRIAANGSPNSRVNINFIENSGNGTRNTITATGGGLNVNLIRNSANGRRNVIVTRGRNSRAFGSRFRHQR